MHRARRKAAAEGRTLTALIEDGVRLALAERPKLPKAKRIRLPLSTATGGFRPGFERLTFSEIEELDDLEYVERMKHFE